MCNSPQMGRHHASGRGSGKPKTERRPCVSGHRLPNPKPARNQHELIGANLRSTLVAVFKAIATIEPGTPLLALTRFCKTRTTPCDVLTELLLLSVTEGS